MDFLFENTGTLLDWCDALGEQAKTVAEKLLPDEEEMIQFFVLVFPLED